MTYSGNLKLNFSNLLSAFASGADIVSRLWTEVETAYNGSGRFYHNLAHLENMIVELEPVRSGISHYPLLLLSVFYHDIVYSATSTSNEEKSAELAVKRLRGLQLSENNILQVKEQILATKRHQLSVDDDTNYLLDADLSVLGQEWNVYLQYTKQIRQEYAIYPDLLYKPGRKKVLKHFLAFDVIFKTPYFIDKYEACARENLEKELMML